MKRPFFLSLILFFFLSPWASAQTSSSPFLGSAAYLESLIKKADSLALADSREWLLLGHYKPLWPRSRGYKTEIDGLHFFFAKDGDSNPQAELRATLKAFFEPIAWHPKDHPQCRYLARRSFLLEKLEVDTKQFEVLDCKFQSDWKKKLNADSVSIIFAASYMNNPASMFGHTFLKFHSQKQSSDNDLLNYGLNFAATTGSDGGMTFMLKGLIGGYKGEFSLMPYYLKLLDYSNVEGRDIWEYRLTLTPKEVERLIDHLLELEQTHFDYYFFSENCSYQLLGLLEWARPSLYLQDYFFYEVIPADTVTLIAEQDNLIADISYRPALRQNLEGRLQLLNPEEETLAKEFIKDHNTTKLLSNIKDRSKESQAHILDAALAFGAIQEFKKRDEWKNPLFALQSARAKLALPSERLRLQSHFGPPHEAHPPARFNAGPGYASDGGGFIDLGLRLAYHELTDSDVGLLAGSQIQFAFMQGRWYEQLDKFELTRARLFDLISLSPWGIYQKPLSWKAAFGYENTFGEDMAHLSGGVGASFDPLGDKNLLLGIFADAEADYHKDFYNDHFLGAGAGAVIRWQPNPKLRFLLQTQSLWNTAEAEWRHQSQFNASYNWSAKQQINLRLKNQETSSRNVNEVMLTWERFILL